eukprot:TRINITY_DN9721_c0_g2_i1.p1 TRINITY_DN9721_c0_g2~~TRINITY_DN9721_c0_g2_i1.p1  ORF type:complete len:461 (+),score=103.84 TRINITY_DN9721_c0_g2_i1:40-1422(+)
MATTSNPLAAAAAAASIPFPNPKRTFVQNRYSQLSTKNIIAAEHRIELSDLLQEGSTALKAIYRSKFLIGEYLKYVDANYNGDGIYDFNVTTPPPFESTYVGQKKEEEKPSAETENIKEKLRTAEELIKKLYKRNSHMEIENKYLKSELSRRDKQPGSKAAPGTSTAQQENGQIPRHPLMNKRMLRRCKSCPPTRVILCSAIGGDRDRNRSKNTADNASLAVEEKKEEESGVTMLRQKVLSLTEALVSCQHENNRLSKEKKEKISLRDSLIKKYFLERDSYIAQLHNLLQEVSEKIDNPMRLTRVKQPAASINPIVAGNNMLKEVGSKLTDQISSVTTTLLHGGDATNEDLLKSTSSVTDLLGTHGDISGRKRELLRRVKKIVEGLPVDKKKPLLQLILELRQVNRSLVDSNATIMHTYEELKVRLNNDLIQEKLGTALLKDQVRSLGGTVDDEAIPSSQ